MVGARGFEPPTPWSRTRFQPFLKLAESYCPQLIATESFARCLSPTVELCCFRLLPQPQFRPQRGLDLGRRDTGHQKPLARNNEEAGHVTSSKLKITAAGSNSVRSWFA